MGSVDCIIRVSVAVVLVASSLIGITTGIATFILPVVGIVLVVTSFFGFCPLYVPFGITTCDEQEHDMKGNGVN